MNKFQIQICKTEYEDNEKPIDGIRFEVDGKSLLEIIREHEKPFAEKENHPELAGKYANLKRENVNANYLLGKEDAFLGENGKKTAVLECSCGTPGCWPLACNIIETDNEILWADFEQVHRNRKSIAGFWNYDKIGPYHFDNEDYLRELGKLKCKE